MSRARNDVSPSVQIAGSEIRAGERRRVEVPLARVPATQLMMAMPVEVVNGRRRGPSVWVGGAVHGDELNGVEIIRQVRRLVAPDRLRGTIFAVPIVNMFAFNDRSRYLPDRRDLNRSFPGSSRGSLAARLAAVFMERIVARCQYGIDLHTGSDHRRNIPQIRADLRDPETRRCAEAFGAPVMIDARTRDGSLRDAAARLGKHVLLYEGGEAQRYNRDAVESGVRGVLGVLVALDMIDAPPGTAGRSTAPAVTKTQWVRARSSGLLRTKVWLGDRVVRGQTLGIISDAFGEMNLAATAPRDGLVLGITSNPLVHRGDALLNLAVEFEGDGTPDPDGA